MSDTKMNLVKEAEGGKLYETNTFLTPVLTGTAREIGAQYGVWMGEHMEAPSPRGRAGRSTRSAPSTGPANDTF